MCGIASIQRWDHEPVDPADLRRMCSAIAHRGPDDAGLALLGRNTVGLGHVRLSIVDLGGGHQPLYNEDHSIAVVANGEIYDYPRLHTELTARGHRFRTRSDSELLVHLYEEYGTELLGHLNGEFAFILWDNRSRRLLAAKDPCGVKPLYCYRTPHEMMFCSEAKGILAVERVPRALSTRYLTGPALGVYVDDASAFDQVKSVRPGHFMLVEADGQCREQAYYQPSFVVEEQMTFDDAAAAVRERLTTAVRRRLAADVPVHAYLSGGLDSTLICGLMAQAGQRFTCYNVGFPDSPYDESAKARRIAEHYGQQFETIPCNQELIAGNIAKAVYATEMPLSNYNSIAKMILSGHVRRRGVKVCLTGEGSDELFAGYPYFKLELLWRLWAAGGAEERAARALHKRFCALEARSQGLLWDGSERWRRATDVFGYPSFFHLRARDAERCLSTFFELKNLAVRPEDRPRSILQSSIGADRLAGLDPFNKSRLLTYNQLYNLVIPSLGDRVEMIHSLECRPPFLDRELIDLAGAIPPRHFMDINQLREKRLLHEAFRGLLPPAFDREHKHPFLAPTWTSIARTQAGRSLFAEFMAPAALRAVGVFRPRRVALLRGVLSWCPLPRGLARKLDALLGTILTVQVLHHLFVENRVACDPHFPMADRSPEWMAEPRRAA